MKYIRIGQGCRLDKDANYESLNKAMGSIHHRDSCECMLVEEIRPRWGTGHYEMSLKDGRLECVSYDYDTSG